MSSFLILCFSRDLNLCDSWYLFLIVFHLSLLIWMTLNLFIYPFIQFHILFLLFRNRRTLRYASLSFISLPLLEFFLLHVFHCISLLLKPSLHFLSLQVLSLLCLELLFKLAHVFFLFKLCLLRLQLFFQLFFFSAYLLISQNCLSLKFQSPFLLLFFLILKLFVKLLNLIERLIDLL